jgi:hypothetical protein
MTHFCHHALRDTDVTIEQALRGSEINQGPVGCGKTESQHRQ